MHSCGTNRLGKLLDNFPISNNLLHIINFPTTIPSHDFNNPALLGLLLFSDLSIWPAVVFTP